MAVSLSVTLTVLVGTVAVVYGVFPKRHNEILSIAIEHHRQPEEGELSNASRGELIAWSVGLQHRPVPFPVLPEGVVIERAYALRVFRRPVALVRLQVDDEPVTLMALQARDVPPHRRREVDGDLIAQSWREGKWTFVAVGKRETAELWRPLIGAK